MQKRSLIIAIAIALFVLPFAGAIAPSGYVIYGQSQGIVRSTTLPTENVHMQAQQEATVVAQQQLSALESKIDSFSSEMGDLKIAAENQRTETSGQLGNINRELGAIKAGIEGLNDIQRQVSEIKPQLEQPREIIPPMSLMILSMANAVLLVVVIVLIFWLKGQWKAGEKESHLEEHSMIHLTDFVKEAMHKGASLVEIRKRLLQRGWSEAKIDDAIQEVRTMHAA